VYESPFSPLGDLAGRTGTAEQLAGYVVSEFVKYLALLFKCEIDVQKGDG
jgi:hypothetical protein